MLPERGEDTASGEHMTKRTHRSHSPAFKAKVALSAVNGEKTLAELARLLETTASNIFTAPFARHRQLGGRLACRAGRIA
jgi:hypothetical protein